MTLAPVVTAAALVLAPLIVDARRAAQPVFRGGVDVVHLGATVTDRRGNLITGLTAGDFEIYEDGRRHPIEYFASGDAAADGVPLHLGVLLDVSESMASTIGFTRTAAIKFLNTLREAVDITVVDFDTEVRLARYSQADFPRVVERIREQEVKGWTALYDAIGLYLDGAADQDGRTVMLLYTDGGDTRSALRFSELMDLLKASGVTVYAIAAPAGAARGGRAAMAGLVLRQIAEATGGAAFFPESLGALDKAYAQVLADVRAQYTLGYVSTNPRRDGQWRTVEIRLREPRDRRVRSRRGYFAPLAPGP